MTTSRYWCVCLFVALLFGCGTNAPKGPPPATGNDPVTFDATVYGPGEGAGFLRILPEEAPLLEWSPHEVIVVRDAPLDLSVVAALLSAGPQSGASHLSLRLKEKNVPNASVPDIYKSKELMAMNGSLVYVRIDDKSIEIRPTTMEEAEALWARKRPVVGPLQLDLQQRDWTSFVDMRHRDAPAFGVKAANLGELYQVVPPANRVSGFGIPASVYEDFIRQSGLGSAVDDLIADKRLISDPAWKRQRLKMLRKQIEATPAPAGLLAQVVDRATAVFGSQAMTERLRFRSSTNAEDLEAFSGAGLYESHSGCLADDLDADAEGPSHCLDPEQKRYFEAELVKWQGRLAREPQLIWIGDIIDDLTSELHDEKSALRAIRKVWSSLWNDRAYDERDYYGVDHARVKMAIAVIISEKEEQLEAVAFTNVRFRQAPPFYELITQAGEIGVVRPIDPRARSEARLFYRGQNNEITQDLLLSPSSESPQGASLWSPERLAELGRVLFAVQDYFEVNVYPGKPLSLDIELKITRDDRLLVKQARPYLSELPPF
jgi:pyruvate, water dikinase